MLLQPLIDSALSFLYHLSPLPLYLSCHCLRLSPYIVTPSFIYLFFTALYICCLNPVLAQHYPSCIISSSSLPPFMPLSFPVAASVTPRVISLLPTRPYMLVRPCIDLSLCCPLSLHLPSPWTWPLFLGSLFLPLHCFLPSRPLYSFLLLSSLSFNPFVWSHLFIQSSLPSDTARSSLVFLFLLLLFLFICYFCHLIFNTR